MKISDLRHRIKLLERATNRDSEGNVIESWHEKATVWASIKPLLGREYYAAAAVQAEKDMGIIIRHRSDITTDMRIEYKGIMYDIRAVVDSMMRHQTIHLRVREVIGE